MKRMFIFFFIFSVFCLHLLWFSSSPAGGPSGFDPGTYRVEIFPIGSDGTVGSRTSFKDISVGADRKLTFSLANLPTYPTTNFLLVRVKNASNETVRQAIAPAPKAGEETKIGISLASVSQTHALLKAMEDAGSDDPIMVLFGFTLIRTGALEPADIETMGVLARVAVLEGFNAYLRDNVDESKMRAFRETIQNRLGEYTSKIKELVDNVDAEYEEKKAIRGEAGAMLSRFLVDAAAAAGFDPALIPPAMKAMSDKAAMLSVGLSEPMAACMDLIMGTTYLKIMAEVVKQKYTSGLEVLGASEDQIRRMNDAVEYLSNQMLQIFMNLESYFLAEEQGLAEAETYRDLSLEVEDLFQIAFNTFIEDTESTAEEINAMVEAIKTGACGFISEPGDRALCEASVDLIKGTDPDYNADGFFRFVDMSGNWRRWPIPMVVAVKWVMDNYPTQFHYIQDSLTPAPQHWLSSRYDFTEFSLLSALSHILELREDIEIVYGRRMAGEIAASCDIHEDDWDSLSDIEKNNYSGMTDNPHTFGDERVLRIVSAENTAEDDDLIGLDPLLVPRFEHCNDKAPFLYGYEVQGLEDILLERLKKLKQNIGPEAVTEAQRQALIDVLSAPRFR